MSTCSPPTGSTPRTRGTTRPWWPPGPPFWRRGTIPPSGRRCAPWPCETRRDLPAPALLDSGCGEGYYTQGLFQALARAGRAPEVAGVDISKFALRRAAKRVKEGEFAVARCTICRWRTLGRTCSPTCSPPCARRSSPGWCAPRMLLLCGPLRQTPVGDERGPVRPAL